MKEGWTYKKLEELAVIKSGYTPSSADLLDDGVLPYFKVGDMNNEGNEKYLYYTSSFVDTTFKSFPKDSIVFPKNGAAIATNKKRILSRPSVVDLNTAVLIPNNNANVEFLFYWICKIDFRDITRRGAVPTLDTKTLMKLDVPYPSPSKQERIVAELDLLSSVIDKKKAQLSEYDKLAQSIFYDMFGDPITNEKGWEVKMISDTCSITCGQDYKTVEDVNGKYPIYGTGGIMGWANQFRCPKNSVIIGRKGNINNPILVDVDFWNVDTAFGVTPDKDVLNVIYFFFFCKEYDFTQHDVSVTIPSLRRTDILKIKLPLPPLSLQLQFAEKIEAIEKQKALVQASVVEIETLFNSRMDYYFN